MNYLYVSRHFNRSGYYILEHLLRSGRLFPRAILLPARGLSDPLNDKNKAGAERERYAREVAYFGCRALRFMKSISLLADEYNIPVIFRESIKDDDTYMLLKSIGMDLIILGGGWPELIPRRVIDLPRLGIINTHPSLLPEFRGTDVHRWQICCGVNKSGITIHYVDEKFDTGNILGQLEVPINSTDTPQELADKTGRVAGPLMEKILTEIEVNAPNRVTGQVQANRDDRSRYFSRWKWENRDFLRIDWSQTAKKINNFVRACTQESYKYNGPFFFVNNTEYILRKSSLAKYNGRGNIGEIVNINLENIGIRCSDEDEVLLLTQVQQVMKNNNCVPALSVGELANNERLKVGDRVSSKPISLGGT